MTGVWTPGSGAGVRCGSWFGNVPEPLALLSPSHDAGRLHGRHTYERQESHAGHAELVER